MQQLISTPSAALKGRIRVPGDKSISHRALMLGAVAVGATEIAGLLEGEDVLRTAEAMRALGAEIQRHEDGRWTVYGVGVGGLTEPDRIIDMGNSGTGARLLTGLLATHGVIAFLTGDASLVKRPMARVTVPLARMGAEFVAREGGRLPMAVIGTRSPVPIRYEVPVPSAQVKSAILLAGLNAPGTTTVVEKHATRDHTENMLRHFGAELTIGEAEEGGEAISLTGEPELLGCPVMVPGDISSAAFPIVAALIRPDSDITIEAVGINPRRTGILDTLIEMGGRIDLLNQRDEAGEPVADIRVRGSALFGVDVPPERAPSMIDEYPVLAMAAACADGPTRMLGVGELRVKESDRLAMTAAGLAACGAAVEAGEDTLVVTGDGRAPSGGATVKTDLDHRIAMSFLVLGLAAREPVALDDAEPIETSFPGFSTLLNGLGAKIAPPTGR
ncbi:MAG: 3-phosphoshikimate 1-carboxyvinyltransferase [Inquilinus sp.]|nr:3-phosphoshikimate 1-carboxyvinyltransferase [Inquilinus sp.]